MGKFSDSPYFILHGYVGNIDPYGTVYPNAGHLITGQNHGIVVKGGYGFDIWLEAEERYYRLRVLPVSGTPSDNKFELVLCTDNYRASELTTDELAEYDGYKVYFRRLGTFHDYVDSIDEYENYMNTNILYLYFGKIYRTAGDDRFYVIFDHLFYYADRAIPMIDRSSNLLEFFYLSLDKIHSEAYGMTKNLWSLQDPSIVNSKYLEYLYKIYDSDIIDTSTLQQREAADGLPSFLKRKGAYSSLFIIWKTIIGNTTDHLNIYERWHDWPLDIPTISSDNPYNPTQKIPIEYFEDYLYTSYPAYDELPPIDGAGYVYYNGVKPTETGYYVYTNEIASDTWGITHNLGTTDIAVEVTDLGGYVIQPGDITIIDENSIIITFPENTAGLASIVSCVLIFDHETGESTESGAYTHTQTNSSTAWNVQHNLGLKYAVVEVQNESGEVVKPSFVEFIDKNSLIVDFDIALSGKATVITGVERYNELYGAYLHTEDQAKTEWNIYHNLDIEAVNIEIIDTDDITILPDSIQMYDENYIIVRFSEGIAGKAFIAGGGSIWRPTYPTYEYDEKMLTPHYRMEIDLTNEPLNEPDILDEDTITELIRRWEEMKPVCKYSHYTTLISPITDFSGNFISLYSGLNAGLYTACSQFISTTSGMVLHTQSSASKTWIVLHNLSSASVIVQCFDTNRKMVMPDKITCISSNIVEIEFSADIAGYAFISPPGEINEHTASNLTWIVNHFQYGPGTNYQYMLAQIENDNRETIIPLTLTENVSSMTVTFAVARSGYTLIGAGDYLHTQSSTSPLWRINHNLNAVAVQVQCFDENDQMMIPQEIELKDENSVWVRFNTSKTGTAVIKQISSGVDSMDTLIDKVSYFKIGTGGGADWPHRTADDLETPVARADVSYLEDNEFYYIEGTIPAGSASGLSDGVDVTEIGVFDNSDNLVTYTYCSTIHKHLSSEFKIWLRMEKKN